MFQFLIQFDRYLSKDDTWEPYDNVKGEEMVAFIERENIRSHSRKRQKVAVKATEKEDDSTGDVVGIEEPWQRTDWDLIIEENGGMFPLARLKTGSRKATVFDVCDEWIYGIEGRPPIEYLDHRFPDQSWLKLVNGLPGILEYNRRRAIVVMVERLEDEEELGPEDAMQLLEDIRGNEGWSIKKLAESFLKK
jgi:hypothetical protein